MKLGGWTAVMVVACGPTAVQIKTAKDATSAVSVQDVFAAAEQETANSYPIGERLPTEGVFGTVPQWFTDSGRASRAPEAEQIKAGNVLLTFAVLVFDDGSGTKVSVQASIVDHVPGPQPTTRELVEGAPDFPAWATGRADKLRVAIHQRVQRLADERPPTGAR